MKEWLTIITDNAVVIINAMALVIIAIGTIEAFFKGLRSMLSGSREAREFRLLYLRYARCLIAALTFQLAADILETAITPNWDEIGRLAAIAVIRTFLNYFLERDMKESRETSLEQIEEPSRPNG